MSTTPTSALTFGDLILAAAIKMGCAYYGTNGDEEAQVPVDDHDLASCQRHVNNAVRMFIADAPPTGWRWTRPVASVVLWPDVAVNAAVTVTSSVYDSANEQSLLTATAAVFYETMEEKFITITGAVFGSAQVKKYVSPTQVYVYGDTHSVSTPKTFSIASNDNYTLPRTFAGAFTGAITFAAATNRAAPIEWTDEATIRQMRENATVNTGTPRLAAIVLKSDQRRYFMETWPQPAEVYTLQFPFELSFDLLTASTDSPPTPLIHDETLRAAVLAVVERDVDDTDGPAMAYYGKCVGKSYEADARSGPRKLGYFGSGKRSLTPGNFRDWMQRPNVSYDTP